MGRGGGGGGGGVRWTLMCLMWCYYSDRGIECFHFQDCDWILAIPIITFSSLFCRIKLQQGETWPQCFTSVSGVTHKVSLPSNEYQLQLCDISRAGEVYC